MFSLVTGSVSAITEAFLASDQRIARDVVAADHRLDELQRRIEVQVDRSLTSGRAIPPAMASAMITALRIVPELERTGDLVEHIAMRTSQRLASQISARSRAIVAEMGRLATDMWRLAADAYAATDATAADRLRLLDDELDDAHVSLAAELAASDITVPIAIEMGLVARFYERIGDHAVNVSRRLHPAGRAHVAVHE
jgi:phosphate transport system protein